MKTTFFKLISILVPREKLSYAHKLVKRLFSSELPNVQMAGRQTLCKKVAISDKGSEYFRNYEGISYYSSFSTSATAVAKGNSSQSKRKISSGGGDRKSLEKGCNSKSSYEKGFCEKSVSEQSISSEEKGWGEQTCDQFEKSKSVHSKLPFQNGDPAIIEGYPQAGRLLVQIGSKRCIFLHLICGGVEEIREILLGFYWDLYQFLCLCFGLAPAPCGFTKLLKILIAFLRRIGTLIIIYLDDVLLIGRTSENVQMYRDTVIFLL